MSNDGVVCAITGAGGYVGSRISERIAGSARVVALTRKAAGESDIAWSLESTASIEGELRRRGVNVLVHSAWDFSAVTPEAVQRLNVEGSKRLIEAARAAGVDRIVFISTVSAFAGARSMYGTSKLEVEAFVASHGGIVIRPGLVYGANPGGVFGAIRKQVCGGKFIPMIGDGTSPQYLVPEETLAEFVAKVALGEIVPGGNVPITVANPTPWPFRDLVLSIARSEGREVTLVPLPWRLLYAGLRCGEALGLKLPFRSDSVVSFIYQDPAPDFGPIQELGFDVPAYQG